MWAEAEVAAAVVEGDPAQLDKQTNVIRIEKHFINFCTFEL